MHFLTFFCGIVSVTLVAMLDSTLIFFLSYVVRLCLSLA